MREPPAAAAMRAMARSHEPRGTEPLIPGTWDRIPVNGPTGNGA
jgi:hypothetical protein